MKTLKLFTQAGLGALIGALGLSQPALAREANRQDASALIYNSQAANPAIHSYQSAIPILVRYNPTVLYVSQAYGPAIHSYAHPGVETLGTWDARYVSQAYGPAIYSYPRNEGLDGEVQVWPLRSLTN